ncbi:hypothetical protein EJ05DRAFT_61030 [Pseudovirgaria hyperparasitica]|uniref:Phospholipase A2 n=1 Tax=Pseudovirgaria hyperparasitica TaxID=470096 RepID=A0A6A6W6S5_9PEZI|nr:uncharacterized protein EJ05DRAFT_61030 [Pseudovirgaria hyperparasitica]KAF2757267.1 hypothetical protein EJ05DRAFT_61030 [Pseudovirgaria hyperparasitica]
MLSSYKLLDIPVSSIETPLRNPNPLDIDLIIIPPRKSHLNPHLNPLNHTNSTVHAIDKRFINPFNLENHKDHEPSVECNHSGVAQVLDCPIEDFAARWLTTEPECMDWTTAECAQFPPDMRNIMDIDLRLACKRHDFAYRSHRKFDGQFTLTHRAKADRQFMRDVFAACEDVEDPEIECRTVSGMFYEWVLKHGDGYSRIDPHKGLVVEGIKSVPA